MEGILKEIKDQWQRDKDRKIKSAEIYSIYKNEWLDQYGANLLRQILMEQYPTTHKFYYPYLDTSVNLLDWGTSKICNIYSNPPTRTINDQPIPTYDSRETNLTFAVASKINFAQGQAFLRPMVRDGVFTWDVIRPEKVTVLEKEGDSQGFRAVAYEAANGNILVWTDDQHWVFSDRSFKLERSLPIDSNPGNVNPYGVIPIIMARAQWQEGDWWDTFYSNKLCDAARNMAISLTQINRMQAIATAKRIAIGGKAGEDFPREQINDPAYPLLLGLSGEAKVLDSTADVVAQVDAALELAGTALNAEGINPRLIRGTSSGQSSGYKVKLEMSDLEARRDEQRTLWTAWEENAVDVSRIVVDVERTREGNGEIEAIPEGDFGIEYANTAPEASQDEKSLYWEQRLRSGVASRWQAVMDMDGISMEQAIARISEIDADRAARFTSNSFGLDENGNGGEE